MARPIEIRVVCYYEDGVWNAQCLEFDVGAQAKSLWDAIERFHHTMAAEIVLDLKEGREPLSQVPAAPPEFERWFEQSRPLGELPAHQCVPDRLQAINVPQAWQIEDMDHELRVR